MFGWICIAFEFILAALFFGLWHWSIYAGVFLLALFAGIAMLIAEINGKE